MAGRKFAEPSSVIDPDAQLNEGTTGLVGIGVGDGVADGVAVRDDEVGGGDDTDAVNGVVLLWLLCNVVEGIVKGSTTRAAMITAHITAEINHFNRRLRRRRRAVC